MDIRNNMAAKLDEYRRSSLDDLMTAKKRIEAIVNTLHEPIIGLDPEKTILFNEDTINNIIDRSNRHSDNCRNGIL